MKALATFATGKHRLLLDISMPRFQVYADRHNYELQVGDGFSDGRPASWGKIPFLKNLLQTYDEVLWMDADLLIVNGSEDLAVGIPATAAQAMVTHRVPSVGQVPNLGLWWVNRSVLPLLDLIWELEVFWNHVFWEQAACILLMGYALNPSQKNQSIFQLRKTKWSERSHELPLMWNSHPLNVDPNPRILHCWTVKPIEHRVALMKQLALEHPTF